MHRIKMELRIKEIMKNRGVKGMDLAQSVGISNVSLSNILTGKFNPSIDTLERIAEALNVELYELFAPSKNLIRCPRCGCLIEAKEYKSEAAHPEN